MKLFVAVEASAAVSSEVERVIRELSASGSEVGWVAPATAHWTLHYFGESSSAELPVIGEAMKEAAASAAPFELELGPGGSFPEHGAPYILWLGLRRGEPELRALAERVRDSLASRRYEMEERPFKAHLTIGRIRKKRDGAKALQLLQAQSPQGSMTVQRITLMQTIPETPKVGSYVALERVELGA